MQILKLSLLVFFALGFQVLFGQNESTKILTSDLNGLWEIDLRPTPDAEPYLKDFIIQMTNGKSFSGSFYDTPFKNGKINSVWGDIHFAFSTKDRSSTYVTTGYFDGDILRGTTYCEERNFVAPWTGKRKKNLNN